METNVKLNGIFKEYSMFLSNKKLCHLVTICFVIQCSFLYAADPELGNGVKKHDKDYMGIALQLTKPNQPFSALIVDNETGKILAQGLGTRINPTFHGEVVAINNLIKDYPHIDRNKVTLYTTAEPCPMCQSAIIWASISRTVFGTSIQYLKKQGWNQIDINAATIINKAPFYKGSLTGGILADKTDKLFFNRINSMSTAR
jgi:tRNA(adenine34) deaminase